MNPLLAGRLPVGADRSRIARFNGSFQVQTQRRAFLAASLHGIEDASVHQVLCVLHLK